MTIKVELDDIVRFAKAVGADHPLHSNTACAVDAGLKDVMASPTLLFSLRARQSPILPILTRLGFADMPGRMFHGSQSFSYEAPVCVGDLLTFQDHVEKVTRGEGGGSSSAVVATHVSNAGGERVAAMKYTAVMLGSRTRTGSPVGGAKAAVCAEVDDMPIIAITPALIQAYAEASGDQNPIHVDNDYARSVGLPGVIGHGMLTMGQAVSAICRHVSVLSLRSTSMKFHAYVRPGDRLFMRHGGVDEAGVRTFAIFDQNSRHIAAGDYVVR